MEANKIIEHLVEISKGECSISEKSILNMENTEDQSIAFGLLTLHEEIKFKQSTLEKANREKDLLLKEVNHRVKNNLQLISSLISIHSQFIDGSDPNEILLECKNRIQTMSLIHEKLNSYKNHEHFDISHYLKELTEDIVAMHLRKEDLALKISMEPILVSFASSVSLGLMVTELLNNSIKHAFRENDKKEICIKLEEVKKKKARISFSDNGSGHPDELFENTKETLGLQLVKDIVHQIEGNIEKSGFSEENGTHYTITFSI